jgi:O-methyltransferase
VTEREMAEFLGERGWGFIPPDQYLIDTEPAFREIWDAVKPFTMTSPERGYSLFKAVEYIRKSHISGDFVECGVWKGGSCMLIAKALQRFGDGGRHLHLYDTFTGMTDPTSEDIIAWNDRSIADRWEEDKRADKFGSWSIGVEEVRRNMISTGYDTERLHFIVGDICETIDNHIPDSIALLRLDTDWYASTVKELDILYPRVVSGGILIVDDYGHFKGARKAVDEYFEAAGFFPYLSRSDYTGRVLVKP